MATVKEKIEEKNAAIAEVRKGIDETTDMVERGAKDIEASIKARVAEVHRGAKEATDRISTAATGLIEAQHRYVKEFWG